MDSSVAAALLKEEGYDLVGVTFHLWDAAGENKVGRCCAPEDREDARRTCDALGIPHYVLDERAAFRAHVVDPFIATYRAGATPSPCVHCNQHVKLARLAEVADELGAASIATGHYARIARDTDDGTAGIAGDASSAIRLLRGRDLDKDQSYFLYGVPTSILARMIFPLGELTKGRTREEGRRLGVPNWDKKDSQELCFVPDGDVGGFIQRESDAGSAGGPIEDALGERVGQHDGYFRYTVGQRRGLGLGGGAPPRYVLAVIPERRAVVVGSEDQLYARDARASSAHWTSGAPVDAFEAEVQVRFRHRAAPARVTPDGDGFRIDFVEPQRSIAPGQAAVVYRGDQVIGGGLLQSP
ncbi:MAG: tRNA 2-thiouridine(34) synthase MnmA [Sandaracinaceae bacterium]